jgi:16S rRNA processing protein RimM
LQHMIRIGKVVAAHGLQGAIVLTHIIGDSQWLPPNTILFLEMNKESYIPFFVASAKAGNEKEYIVTLEDVNRMEDAKKLVGKKVYVEEAILSAYAAQSPLLWIGFNIVDREKGSLGLVEDVLQTGHQWLARINFEGREVLIPLIQQMIVEVNVKNKFIRMDLPEGLLDL